MSDRMAAIRIPRELADAVEEDDLSERREWLERLPGLVAQIASEWELALGEPYVPSGQCAWVAPAGEELVLKLGWRHPEAEHEAEGLRFWDGDGAVRCFAERTLADTTALLLERCRPGTQLATLMPEPEQDAIVAALARRLHGRSLPADGHPFGSLADICERWSLDFERAVAAAAADKRSIDSGIARAAVELFHDLPRSADRAALLCIDLHAGNVLASEREPWLVIDPKPFVGDPAFDAVQHMLNCEERLMSDPVALTKRMASLFDVGPERARLWLFVRCAQESLGDPMTAELARRLAP